METSVGSKSVGAAGCAVGPVQPIARFPLERLVQDQIERLHVGQDRRIGLAGIAEPEHPFHGRVIGQSRDLPLQPQTRPGIGPGRKRAGPSGVEQRLAGLLLLPLWQQLVAGLVVVEEGEGVLRRRRLAPLQQLVEPPGLAVPGDDLGLGPVGVVAGGTVAGVAHIEDQGVGSLEVEIDSLRLLAAAEHTRAVQLAAVGGDAEDDRARPAGRRGILVHADPRREPRQRLPAADDDLSDRMSAQSVLEMPAADGQGRADDGPVGLQLLEVLPHQLQLRHRGGLGPVHDRVGHAEHAVDPRRRFGARAGTGQQKNQAERQRRHAGACHGVSLS